jgi:hypothetical protein
MVLIQKTFIKSQKSLCHPLLYLFVLLRCRSIELVPSRSLVLPPYVCSFSHPVFLVLLSSYFCVVFLRFFARFMACGSSCTVCSGVQFVEGTCSCNGTFVLLSSHVGCRAASLKSCCFSQVVLLLSCRAGCCAALRSFVANRLPSVVRGSCNHDVLSCLLLRLLVLLCWSRAVPAEFICWLLILLFCRVVSFLVVELCSLVRGVMCVCGHGCHLLLPAKKADGEEKSLL